MKQNRSTKSVAIDADPRWQAVLTRDARADGTFVYAVATTGVYCRPSCPSRRARPEHVTFHRGPADAERAGFRPCKRCKPGNAVGVDPRAERVAAVCRLIEACDSPPSLRSLAEQVGLSPFHLHRQFKAATGLTPKAYASARRAARVQAELTQGATVTTALYNAGYNSQGRFYADAGAMLGMTPSAYRAGGMNQRIQFAVGPCSLGTILVAATARGVCAILLGDEPDALVRDLRDRFPRAELQPGDRGFESLVARAVGLVEAPNVAQELPLDVRGTAFQRRVWEALRAIPAGTTASYAEIARRIGAPKSARAVAQACAANAIAVAIPCHRVVRSDGGVSGYRWGIARKRALLEREAKP